jgi:hypothetical protein
VRIMARISSPLKGNLGLLRKTNTFSADANNIIDFTATRTSGGLSPKIRVYNPAGALIATEANCSATAVELSLTFLQAASTLCSSGTAQTRIPATTKSTRSGRESVGSREPCIWSDSKRIDCFGGAEQHLHLQRQDRRRNLLHRDPYKRRSQPENQGLQPCWDADRHRSELQCY